MFKRIAFFLVTNLLIVLTISTVLQVLGVRPYLTASGIDYSALMVFCLAWGMTGSFISLAMSRMTAKWMMGVELVDGARGGEYAWLVQTVHRLSRQANLPAMPEVGVYQSPDVNAFATGPTKSRSLVAVSTGLMSRMSQNEIEGVLAHEVAHIQNGDMVTMTLIQGVVNAFVMFFARIISYFVAQSVKEDMRYTVQFAVTMLLEIVFGILGMLVVCWFSRAREFRADKGSAALSGKENMIAALEALKRLHGIGAQQEQPASIAAFKISAGKSGGIGALFSTHPPLESRIEALRRP
jgi:heat shock protein HtpX